MTSSAAKLSALTSGVLAGRRIDLARAITLVESSRADHRVAARSLVQGVLQQQQQGKKRRTLRIGLSGSPGVGKSSLIEALGLHIVDQKRQRGGGGGGEEEG